jgi:DNA-binding IclR family transcriptional regulator
MTTKSLDKRVRLAHLTTAKVIKTLLEGPSTAQELVTASGLHLVTVYEFMRTMRRLKIAHIAAWDPDTLGRDCIAVFAMGPGKDAKRRVLTRAQIAKRYRERCQQKALAAALASAPTFF